MNDDEHQAAEDGRGRGPADLARDAALQSLVSNGVYLAVMLGFTVALANRDRIGRLAMRIGRRWSARADAEDRAVAEFRGQLADRTDWGAEG